MKDGQEKVDLRLSKDSLLTEFVRGLVKLNCLVFDT